MPVIILVPMGHYFREAVIFMWVVKELMDVLSHY